MWYCLVLFDVMNSYEFANMGEFYSKTAKHWLPDMANSESSEGSEPSPEVCIANLPGMVKIYWQTDGTDPRKLAIEFGECYWGS